MEEILRNVKDESNGKSQTERHEPKVNRKQQQYGQYEYLQKTIRNKTS
jgi:hypothetical protein